MDAKEARDARAQRKAALATPTNLTSNATRDLSGELDELVRRLDRALSRSLAEITA